MPVANKPILFYAIEAIVAAGITDLGIVVGDTRQEIKLACGDGSQWNCRIRYIEQEAPLGLGHAVKIAQDYIGDEPFVMFLGDNLVVDGIRRLSTSFARAIITLRSCCRMCATRQSSDAPKLDPESGRVVRLEEKPQFPRATWPLSVFQDVFDSSIFEAVNSIEPSGRGELILLTQSSTSSITISMFIRTSSTAGGKTPGAWTTCWKPTGLSWTLFYAKSTVMSISTRRVLGKVHVAKGAKIINSVVRGPAVIGENTVIENAYIGPFTSIYYGCTIKGSEIEHSIVLENSTIDDMRSRVEDSLIGKNVIVGRTSKKPAAYRSMLRRQSPQVSIRDRP